MTKGRKIGISLAFALIFMLVCSCVTPLCSAVDNAYVANAAVGTISVASTWENTYDDSEHNNYYGNLNNTDKTGASLYDDLAALITKTHTTKTSYDGLKKVYKTTDADPNVNGNVIWFYTGGSIPYTGDMDSGNYPTNREHVWPKMAGRAFPDTSDAGSDAHHVRPLNTGLNNTRSNNHFGIVPQTTENRVYQSGTYSNYGSSDLDSWCYQATVNGAKYFYPAAGYRGATARILFYVHTRWSKSNTKGTLSFTLGNGFAADANGRVMSNVDILLQWHLQEPPSEEEIRRNNLVEGVQGNRNPFIDHPEFAEMIYCNDGNNYNNTLKNVVSQYGGYLNGNVGGGGTVTPNPDDPVELIGLTLSASSTTMSVGSTQTITVTATPLGADSSVDWSTSNSSVATVSDGVVTALKEGDVTITATSKENSSIKASIKFTVVDQSEMEGVFTEAMAALSSATTLEERYEAIAAAISAYNQMSQADKNAHATDKATLDQAIAAYNEEISKINGEFQEATNVAAQAIANTVSMSFMALVLIVLRRTVGR